MDITAFVSSHREVLLIADYAAYRSSLSRQLNSLRRRLGIATPKRDKFAQKTVTAEQIGGSHEFLHLLLLTSERAWAHAMHIKTSHADDRGGLTSTGRGHVVSRLRKAAKTAGELVELLVGQKDTTKATEKDVLEAKAYAAMMTGSEEFEKHSSSGQQRSADGKESEESWRACLTNFATTRVIYAALYESGRNDVFRTLLADIVDPTIRYAAYQARLSRTIAIPTVAKRYFPKSDSSLVSSVEGLDQWALKDKPAPTTEAEKVASPQNIPENVTWRGRKANIVDASIGQALASVEVASAKLQEYLSSNTQAAAKDKAAAYDEVLIASQDAADAAKRATDELEKEGVDEGDKRMQDLRVTALAVGYGLVSWRVGRNRMLLGAEDDGLAFKAPQSKRQKGTQKDGKPLPEKEESRSKTLAPLRERLVLYDATIQSINSVKDLRGAVRDETFVAELDAKAAYFRALKCVNISYSHSLIGQHVESLALLKKANDLLSQHSVSQRSESAASQPPTLDISPESYQQAFQKTSTLLSRTHALVELRKLEENSRIAAEKKMTGAAPLVQNLNAYPTPGTLVDVTNLVSYPPKIEPVPVKPLFLDVAWNYIDYPGHASKTQARSVTEQVSEKMQDVVSGGSTQEKQTEQQKKKGWFGFGR
ncbi:hypothetical protein K431DRAFT_228961 [Polychaeton citri CBS 116435]|uniref:Signal recognition particle subunit SRP68 n=1 Tax=Polychaeton citri CBS 116435 TaxID=1314669 RepID=A0A9P4Q4Q5_9PEZI|nr:hypothetical protein K431DRAFT_228961 [Polychaeton citri CBS 116435]